MRRATATLKLMTRVHNDIRDEIAAWRGVFDKTYNNIIRYLGKSSQYRLLKLFDWGHPLAYVDENG